MDHDGALCVDVLFRGWNGDRKSSRCLPNTSKFVPNDRYRTSSELENSVLEINHVTNVTTVLNESAASGWGSRYFSVVFLRVLVCLKSEFADGQE